MSNTTNHKLFNIINENLSLKHSILTPKKTLNPTPKQNTSWSFNFEVSQTIYQLDF
jgi:hypothetical protein